MSRGLIFFRLMLAIYWVALAVVTHLPPTRMPPTRVSDKLAHFVVYALLAVLLWLASGPAHSLWRKAGGVLAIIAVYGAVDELTQPLVGRYCMLDDWLANLAGGAAAVAVMAMIRRRR
jgi:VanZ family protein